MGGLLSRALATHQENNYGEKKTLKSVNHQHTFANLKLFLNTFIKGMFIKLK